MSITIDMGPEMENRLEAAAREQGQSLSEYICGLVWNSLPGHVGQASHDSEDEHKFAEARKRIRAAMASDTEFAKRVDAPLDDIAPTDDPVLDAAYSRKYADELFEERFGVEVADRFRAALSG